MKLKKSTLITQCSQGEAFRYAGHIVGRAYVMAPSALLEDIAGVEHARDRAYWLELIGRSVDNASQTLDHLLRSHILLHGSVDERVRLRDIATQNLRHPELSLISRLVQANAPLIGANTRHQDLTRMFELTHASTLELRTGTVAYPISQGVFLIGHPLALPTLLDERLWKLARGFAAAGRPFSVAREETALTSIAFLISRGILREAGLPRSRGSDPPVQGAPRATILVTPTGTRWGQFYRPYHPGLFERSLAAVQVGLIGPCQIQALGEALSYHGLERGVCFLTEGVMDTELSSFADRRFDQLFLTSSTYADRIYASLGRFDTGSADALIGDFAERVRNTLTELRRYSQAPLSIVDLALPGWWPSVGSRKSAGSGEQLIRKANERLRDLGTHAGQVDFIRSESAVVGHEGELWDDCLHASAHHSSVAHWNWPILKPMRHPGRRQNDVLPAAPALQVDPSGTLARQLAEHFEQSRMPALRAVIIQDEALLSDDDEAVEGWIFPPLNDFSDVEDYVYAGIHEALGLVHRCGVQIALASRWEPDEVRRRWPVVDALSTAMRFQDLTEIISSSGWNEEPHAILERLGVPREQALYLDITGRGRGAVPCLYWAGALAQIRPLLFALAPVDAIGEDREQPPQQYEVSPPDRMEIEGRLLGLFCQHARTRFDTLDAIGDLHNWGIDSVTITALALDIERTFGINLPAWAGTGAAAFNPRALLRAITEQVASPVTQGIRKSVTPRGVTGRALNRLDGTLAGQLASRFAESAPRWSIRIVDGPTASDSRLLEPKELRQITDRWQRSLWRHGLGRNSVVLLALPLSEELVGALFACLLEGVVPLMVAPPPESGEPEGLSAWFNGLPQLNEVRAVITTQEAQGVSFDAPVIVPDAGGWNGQSERPLHHPSGDTRVVAVCSSGTTGTPKTYYHPAARILARIDGLNAALGLTDQDAVCSWVPAHHIIGLVNLILLPVLLGMPTVMVKSAAFIRRPALYPEVLERFGATLTFLPNFAFAVLGKVLNQAPHYDLSCVRAWINAGEPITEQACASFLSAGARAGVQPQTLSAGYGMAEVAGAVTQASSTVALTRLKVEASSLIIGQPIRLGGSADSTVTLLSCGTPIPGISVDIRDVDGNSAPDGHVGLVHVTDPSTDPALELSTHDLGFRHRQEIYVIGRNDDAFNVTGKRVTPETVELLLSSLAEVRFCIAFPVLSEEYGTNQLGIGVELAPDATLDVVRSRIARRIEAGLGLTVRYLCEVGSRIRRTPSGKIQRRATAAALAQALL